MDLNHCGNRKNFFNQVRQILKTVSRQYQGDKEKLLDEKIQFVSPLSLDAPKGDVGEISLTSDKRWRVNVWSRGLTGALGALPTVYTEWLIERYYRYGDRAGKAFLDIFTHRLQCLRFLAWERYHYYAQAELREEMPLAEATQALCGVLHEQSSFSDGRYASLLAPAVRSMVNLESLLHHALTVPVSIRPFSRRWQRADPALCCQLGNAVYPLGYAPMLGSTRWEHQNCFLLTLGPLTQQQALRFFPGEKDYSRLCVQLREYLGPGLDFEIDICIDNHSSPLKPLAESQLGRDACLGRDHTRSSRTLRLSKELTECPC